MVCSIEGYEVLINSDGSSFLASSFSLSQGRRHRRCQPISLEKTASSSGELVPLASTINDLIEFMFSRQSLAWHDFSSFSRHLREKTSDRTKDRAQWEEGSKKEEKTRKRRNERYGGCSHEPETGKKHEPRRRT